MIGTAVPSAHNRNLIMEIGVVVWTVRDHDDLSNKNFLKEAVDFSPVTCEVGVFRWRDNSLVVHSDEYIVFSHGFSSNARRRSCSNSVKTSRAQLVCGWIDQETESPSLKKEIFTVRSLSG